MQDADIAWACGLFEGEGTIGLTGSHAYVALGMVDLEPIERLQELFGGTIYGPYKTSTDKDFWRWNLSGFDAVERLYEWWSARLSPRRKQRFETVLARRPPPKPSSPDCGLSPAGSASQAGWATHHRKGEPPCAPCRAAKAAYMRQWKDQRRG